MSKKKKKKKKKRIIPGAPPGLFPDQQAGDLINIDLIQYNEDQISKQKINHIKKLKIKADQVNWIRVNHIENSNSVKIVGDYFKLHPLVLEDIVDTNQRPKINDFDEYIFIVFRLPSYDKKNNELLEKQICIVLGKNYVLSFHEGDDEFFQPIIERLDKKKGKIREMQSDYLVYALLDLIVDHYFVVMDEFEERVDNLEQSVSVESADSMIMDLYTNKHFIIKLRKSILPIREIIRTMERKDITLIKDQTIMFLHDVYEHTVQITESLETLREILVTIHDVYLSTISNKMNQVMKVLTIFASIFIPLTFIAGLYGMNFKYMPELDIPWAYPVLLGIMAVVSIIMLFYFKSKKWIGKHKKK